MYKRVKKQQQKEQIVLENQEDISEEESEEYSSEDEDAVLLTDRVEEKLLETVARIKSKDPSIYKVVDNIFADDDFEEHNSQHKSKDKKFTYKDLLKQGVHESQQSSQEEEEQQLPPAMEEKRAKNKFKQALMKQNKAKENQDEDEDLFTVKNKLKKEKNSDDAETSQFDEFMKKMKPETKKLIKSVWQNPEQMDHTDVFLRDYIVKKKWLSKHINGQKAKEEFQKVDQEDEQRSVQMDEHEVRYNFRYEEPDGDKIVQYPRKIEGSMRLQTDSRKDKRKKLDERKKEEEIIFRQEADKKKEELKNNILAKINQKQQQEYDENLQEMDEQENVDHDWFFCDDCGKAFHQEETNYQCGECEDYMLCEDCYDLIIHKHPLVMSQVPEGFGAPKQSVSAKILAKLQPCKTCRRRIPMTVKHYSYEDKSKNVQLLCDRCYDESPLDIKKKFSFVDAKINSSNIEDILEKDPEKIKELTNSKEIEDMVDEYLKYDFEDVLVGGLKTKFKYLSVRPESYGLSDEQILFGDDKQLNNYVSIKKMVPYREDKMRLRNNIYKKKVTTIDRTVKYNKHLIQKDAIDNKLRKTRIIDKLKRRSEVMKKKRETKLRILNISNPAREKQIFVPNSRLESYGVTLEAPQQQQTKQTRR